MPEYRRGRAGGDGASKRSIGFNKMPWRMSLHNNRKGTLQHTRANARVAHPSRARARYPTRAISISVTGAVAEAEAEKDRDRGERKRARRGQL